MLQGTEDPPRLALNISKPQNCKTRWNGYWKPLSVGSVCSAIHNCNARATHGHSGRKGAAVKGSTHIWFISKVALFQWLSDPRHSPQWETVNTCNTNVSYLLNLPTSNKTWHFYAPPFYLDFVAKVLTESPLHCFHVSQSGKHSPAQSSFHNCGCYLGSYFVWAGMLHFSSTCFASLMSFKCWLCFICLWKCRTMIAGFLNCREPGPSLSPGDRTSPHVMNWLGVFWLPSLFGVGGGIA